MRSHLPLQYPSHYNNFQGTLMIFCSDTLLVYASLQNETFNNELKSGQVDFFYNIHICGQQGDSASGIVFLLYTSMLSCNVYPL